MNAPHNPEVARSVRTGNFNTNVHDLGASTPGQPPVLFIHGSGPGVSAWANWRLAMPVIAQARRVIAPDMVGFGYTDRPAGIAYTMDTWVQQALDLMDAMGVEQADVVGNSFGGALSLALAIRAPQRVRRLVLMGSVGVPFPITPGLDAVWGYEPSLATMKKLLDIFAHSRALRSRRSRTARNWATSPISSPRRSPSCAAAAGSFSTRPSCESVFSRSRRS